MREPYLRTQLQKMQNHQYSNLSKKLNVHVDKACYVMAIIDELGVLGENEVVLRLSGQNSQKAGNEYIVGDVVVTR